MGILGGQAAFEKLDVARELDWDNTHERARGEEMLETFYPAQRAAYDDIMACVAAETPALFFIDGPGGSGKTYLYEAILHTVRGVPGRIGLACAWSGIASTLLEGGRTCHSRFGLPVPMPREDVTSSISAQSSRAEVLRRAAIILWDEAPMAPREALEAVNQLLQQFMGNELPFGGKVVVLGGDFRQVLPVMPHCSREDIVQHSLKAHPLWRSGSVRVHPLRENKRAAGDAGWRDFLLRMGDGELEVFPSLGPHTVRLPDEIVAPASWTRQDLVDHVFPDLKGHIRACVEVFF